MLEPCSILPRILCIPGLHATFLVEGGARLAAATNLVGVRADALRVTHRGRRAAVRLRALLKVLLVELVTGDHPDAILECHISFRISYRFLNL